MGSQWVAKSHKVFPKEEYLEIGWHSEPWSKEHQNKATTKKHQKNQRNVNKTKIGELSLPTLETYSKASYEDGMVLV